MDDTIARASAVAMWSYEENEAPSEVIDGRTFHHRHSELTNRVLQTVDDETGVFIEFDLTYGPKEIDVAQHQKRLEIESSSSPYMLEDRKTGEKYEVDVDGHYVTVKSGGEEKKIEVY